MLTTSGILITATKTDVKEYDNVVSICSSWMMSDAECFSYVGGHLSVFFWKMSWEGGLHSFWLGYLLSDYWDLFMFSFIYFSPLPDCGSQIFCGLSPHSIVCLCMCVHKPFSMIQLHLSTFACVFRGITKEKFFATINIKKVFPVFPSSTFTISVLTFKSLVWHWLVIPS